MRVILIFFFALISFGAHSQKRVTLSSPDGNIAFAFIHSKTAPAYTLSYKSKRVIELGGIGLSFRGTGFFKKGLRMGKPSYKNGIESYEMVTGKASLVNDAFREVIIPLEEQQQPFRKVNFEVRLFDDGMAFRYVVPTQHHLDSFTLTDEWSSFAFAGNPDMLGLFLPNYTSSHEGEYTNLPLGQVREDILIDMPALFTLPGKIYVAITEAALVDYAGMYLSKRNGVLTSTLSPLPGDPGIKVKAGLPHQSPWRVIMISDRIGALQESTILTSLNEPSKIKDISWLTPGKTSFHWWNGDITPDTTFAPGINFETNQYYIDFCARNNIQYHSVIGYGGIAWYKSDAVGYGVVGPNTDVTQTVPSLNMQEVCDYAKQKGVGIHVWVNWKAIYPDIEKAFVQFEKWGIKGMMVDFLDRDDQEMVNIQVEILKIAAKHKLFIQFHGAYKPTGLSRTYPNEFTREGTLNYENNKWRQQGISPDHDLDVAFTRLLAGATDYHLGGFRALPPSQFKTQFTRPLMIGTRCHMLGMYVVLESALVMVADYPSAYEGQPGFDFLKEVPTTWDETRIPDAELGKYIITARRKSKDWFVGAINNHEGRVLKIPLHFLPEGEYEATIYEDAADAAEHPDHINIRRQVVNRKYNLTVEIAAGGGMVMHIKPR